MYIYIYIYIYIYPSHPPKPPSGLPHPDLVEPVKTQDAGTRTIYIYIYMYIYREREI